MEEGVGLAGGLLIALARRAGQVAVRYGRAPKPGLFEGLPGCAATRHIQTAEQRLAWAGEKPARADRRLKQAQRPRRGHAAA